MNQQSPLDPTVTKIITIVAEYTTQDLAQVDLSNSFESIGVDSLSLVEIIFDIEEAFDINIPSEAELSQEGHHFSTLDDVLTLVRLLIKEKDK